MVLPIRNSVKGFTLSALQGKALSKQNYILRKTASYPERLRHWEGLTIKAQNRLSELIDSPNESIALNASIYCVNRTMGTPRASAQIDVKTNDLTAKHLEALRALARAGEQAIDITPEKDLVGG